MEKNQQPNTNPQPAKQAYVAPEITIMTARVERGFQMSGSDQPLNLPGQDISMTETILGHNSVDF